MKGSSHPTKKVLASLRCRRCDARVDCIAALGDDANLAFSSEDTPKAQAFLKEHQSHKGFGVETKDLMRNPAWRPSSPKRRDTE